MKWIAIAITVRKKPILFPYGGLINTRTKMTQHKDMIEEARRLLNSERENIPSMSKDFKKDYWLLTYPCGKIVKTYQDKRKKDIVIQESFNGGE